MGSHFIYKYIDFNHFRCARTKNWWRINELIKTIKSIESSRTQWYTHGHSLILPARMCVGFVLFHLIWYCRLFEPARGHKLTTSGRSKREQESERETEKPNEFTVKSHILLLLYILLRRQWLWLQLLLLNQSC